MSKHPMTDALVEETNVWERKTHYLRTVNQDYFYPPHPGSPWDLCRELETELTTLRAQLERAQAALRDAERICGDHPASKWQRNHAAALADADRSKP